MPLSLEPHVLLGEWLADKKASTFLQCRWVMAARLVALNGAESGATPEACLAEAREALAQDSRYRSRATLRALNRLLKSSPLASGEQPLAQKENFVTAPPDVVQADQWGPIWSRLPGDSPFDAHMPQDDWAMAAYMKRCWEHYYIQAHQMRAEIFVHPSCTELYSAQSGTEIELLSERGLVPAQIPALPSHWLLAADSQWRAAAESFRCRFDEFEPKGKFSAAETARRTPPQAEFVFRGQTVNVYFPICINWLLVPSIAEYLYELRLRLANEYHQLYCPGLLPVHESPRGKKA